MEQRAQTARELTRSALLAHIKDFVNSLTETKAQTRDTYDRSLREFVRWFDQDGRLLFAVDDVYRYRRYLIHSKMLAPASVSAYMTSLRGLCNHMLVHGNISYNPARYVQGSTHRKRPPPSCLQMEEVARLLAAAASDPRRGKRDRAILELMVRHGLTEEDVVAADVGDFVFISGTGALKLRGREEVRVLLDPLTAARIHEYLVLREHPDRQQPLFLSDGNGTRGMRMTTRGIRARIHHYFQVAGIRGTGSGITPRALRHTAATLMAEAGLSADEIKHRMRFASLARALQYLDRARPVLNK